MKIKLIFLALIFIFFASARNASAIYDPASVLNNRVGIHIFSEKDLSDAANLVNSGGGDWGYVTFVIAEGERDHDRWQKAFDQMRRLHLMPIVRIATKAQGGTWAKPQEGEIDSWVGFLNSLNWVVKNRYVVIGNEPNLAAEWGGEVNAREYAAYLKELSQKLKNASNDFFILPAGLNAEENEGTFIKGMLKEDPKIFDYIDGWSSHAYPTSSINIFNKELGLIGRDLPVFITETGWSSKKLSEDVIGRNLVEAYQGSWNNSKIVAVTPFILDYRDVPFAEFSWKAPNGSFYSFYRDVQGLKKTRGEPIQIVSGEMQVALAQPIIIAGSDFVGAILVKNTGQSIWSASQIAIKSESPEFLLKSYFFDDIEPMRSGLIVFKAQAPNRTGIYRQPLFLTSQKEGKITDSFPIEAIIIRVDQVQIQAIFAKIGAYLSSIFGF